MSATVSAEVAKALEGFIIKEAKLADEGQYQQWEELWADDAVYWVPLRDGDDPTQQVSHLYDNRRRLATRIRQLMTGYRYSQLPISGMRRLISNYEFFAEADGRYRVEANFFLPEYSIQSIHDFRIWSGRYVYTLSAKGDDFQIHTKKVLLVNGTEPVPTMAFLI